MPDEINIRSAPTNLAHFSRISHTNFQLKLTSCILFLAITIIVNLAIVLYSHIFSSNCTYTFPAEDYFKNDTSLNENVIGILAVIKKLMREYINHEKITLTLI